MDKTGYYPLYSKKDGNSLKKKLILITYDLLNAMHYRQELLDFFGGLFELETHTITDEIGEHLKADAVLALSPINNE